MTSEHTSLRRIVRLRARALATTFAVFGGVALFAATSVLLLRGGERVGQHLQLLRHYLPGYSVSWGGALLGLGYGAALGAALGALVATVYNAVTDRRHGA